MFRICPVKIPRSVVLQMVRAGCIREKVPGEALQVLRIDVGSSAWSIYADWASEQGEVDLSLFPFWSPSPETLVVPADALGGLILTEVASIIRNYAPLNMDAFATGPPVISDPHGAPQMPGHVRHAKVAGGAIVERIQHPPENFPTLSNLGAGSYICHINFAWTGAAVVAAVFKQ